MAIALDGDRYSYQALSNSAKSDLDAGINNALDKIDKRDFEYLLRVLGESKELLKTINPRSEGVKDFSNSEISLRRSLKGALIENQLEQDKDFEPKKRQNAENMSPFTNIYTTNYDLTSYWVLQELISYRKNLNLREHLDELSPTFAKNNESERRFRFLHGALYIFHHGLKGAKKVTKSEGNRPLLHQIKEMWKNSEEPMLVMGGLAQQEMVLILENDYLKHCYECLQKECGTLLVFGHSMGESDSHLLDAICRSKLEKVWLPVYEESDRERAKVWFERLREYDKNVRLYNAKNMNWWNSKLWDEAGLSDS